MNSVRAGRAEIPVIGEGTWPMRGEQCRSAVETALSLGYRHVDTAQMYDNETAVGEAIENSAVDRDDVFVVTKLLRENLTEERVHESFRESLDRLGLDTLDLLLIHSPSPTVPITETISAMNELQAEGLVHYIGVSNFSIEELDDAIEASTTPIVTNQVKYHPFVDRGDLLAYCLEHDVALTAYSPLAKGDVIGDETLAEIGDRYGKTAAQVALRWLVQQPMVVAIPKASSEEHLRENLAVFDFELTADEMQRVFELEGRLPEAVSERLGG